MPTESTAAASCWKTPIAGRATAAFAGPVGGHSQMRPAGCSSPESQVPHGVAPPAQFPTVPARIRYALVMVPADEKRSALAPPVIASEFET